MKIKGQVDESLRLAESELIVTPKGAIYHLNVRPDQIADRIIVVGDQNRVSAISRHFTRIDHKIQNREFVTHTGEYNGKRITALSTGIGTDNIDIVLNEIDALFNIDLQERKIKQEKRSVDIVRLGTSGALQEDIPVDSFVLSESAIGFDGLLPFYGFELSEQEQAFQDAFVQQTNWPQTMNPPYFVKGDSALINLLEKGMHKGITVTANGFYGPQGRKLRLPLAIDDLNEKLNRFSFQGSRISNFEMETSALYSLGSLLGHRTATVCAIIANRFRKEYSKDYHKTIDELIQVVLSRLTS